MMFLCPLLCMRRRPPRSTLTVTPCPYTTLVRSTRRRQRVQSAKTAAVFLGELAQVVAGTDHGGGDQYHQLGTVLVLILTAEQGTEHWDPAEKRQPRRTFVQGGLDQAGDDNRLAAAHQHFGLHIVGIHADIDRKGVV